MGCLIGGRRLFVHSCKGFGLFVCDEALVFGIGIILIGYHPVFGQGLDDESDVGMLCSCQCILFQSGV